MPLLPTLLLTIVLIGNQLLPARATPPSLPPPYSTSDQLFDLGQVGVAVPPSEEDDYERIQQLLSTLPPPKPGDLDPAMQRFRQDLADRPGLPKARGYAQRTVRPGYRVKQTVQLHDGTVLAKAGTVLYPLDYVTMPQKWFFFDGSDRTQQHQAGLLWLRDPQVHLAVVKGDPITVTEEIRQLVPGLPDATGSPERAVMQHGRLFRVWDAPKTLVSVFDVKVVPSLVRQAGPQLIVEEAPHVYP